MVSGFAVPGDYPRGKHARFWPDCCMEKGLGPFFPVLPARSGLPSMYDYDMVVIGSGPSGRRAAVQFAKLGKSVLVVEKGRRVGGVSVHTGTIPSKTLRETVLNLSGWRER